MTAEDPNRGTKFTTLDRIGTFLLGDCEVWSTQTVANAAAAVK